jgi:hypothetical protein
MEQDSNDSGTKRPTQNGLDRRTILLSDFPPMQAAASVNLEAVKAQLQKAIAAREGN